MIQGLCISLCSSDANIDRKGKMENVRGTEETGL